MYAANYFDEPEDVKNIVQDVIMSIWEKRAEVLEIRSLRSYLFKSVHYQCLNYIKHEKVKKRFHSEVDYFLRNTALETNDVIESKEQIDEINKAIESLPEQTKRVFKMKRFEQLSYKEIAAQLDISDRTVDSHMTKAMKKLKELLGHLLIFLLIFL